MTYSPSVHRLAEGSPAISEQPHSQSVCCRWRAILIGLAGVCVSVLASGCSHCRNLSYVGQLSVYSRITTSDFEGRPLAQYIAEGPVKETRGGFTFRAVERHIYRPFPLTFRYPFGRPVVAVASNIVVEPAPRPGWLPE